MDDDDHATHDAATAAQRRMMFALWKEAGVTDRETRLRITSEMLRRVVDSSVTLSRRDASVIIDSLLTGDYSTEDDTDDHDENACHFEDLF